MCDTGNMRYECLGRRFPMTALMCFISILREVYVWGSKNLGRHLPNPRPKIPPSQISNNKQINKNILQLLTTGTQNRIHYPLPSVEPKYFTLWVPEIPTSTAPDLPYNHGARSDRHTRIDQSTCYQMTEKKGSRIVSRYKKNWVPYHRKPSLKFSI